MNLPNLAGNNFVQSNCRCSFIFVKVTMADKNKFSPSTSGHSLSSPVLSPDDTTTENADDEDPSLENQDNVEQTLFIKMNAPPENRCVSRFKIFILYINITT